MRTRMRLFPLPLLSILTSFSMGKAAASRRPAPVLALWAILESEDSRRVWMSLDVDRFDARRFEASLDHCARSGIAFTTMAELGDSGENQRRLFELNSTCSADIPSRGEFYTYAEYRSERIDTKTYNAHTVVIALDGIEWIGMSAASDHRERGFFFNEMTGVVRSHRRRGIALVMKVMLIQRIQELHVRTIYTVHHPDNHAPIALNRRLGYVEVIAPAG